MNRVRVTAPARLHFGMLDPAGLGARRFGGLGVGVQGPRVVVELVRRGDGAVLAHGPQAQRARAFATGSAAAFGVRDGVDVDVREAIPPHMGLGSGTKLGLAVARGVAALSGAPETLSALAAASGRGARSSVGSWTFHAPGLVVEAGVTESDTLSPLVTRVAMPEAWRCVLALPIGDPGLAGEPEERVFAGLAQAPGGEPGIARRLLGELLPGLMAADIVAFGAALSAIQREVGAIFAAEQGGIFHPAAAPLVAALSQLGVHGVGQSSWGPAVYGIVDGAAEAERVAGALRAGAGAGSEVSVVDFDRRGAVCESIGAEVLA